MKVFPITTNLFTYKPDFKRKSSPYISDVFAEPVDTFVPSFQAKIKQPIKTLKEFREHTTGTGHHCLYCHKELKYGEKDIKDWTEGGLFSEPIKTIVQHFKQYKPSLHEKEKEVFSMIEELSEMYPDAHLDTVIKIMSILANKDLYKVQKPIFDSIVDQAKLLPEKEKNAIESIIEISKKRIFHQPYIEEYSALELRYQIRRLTEAIPNDEQAKKIEKLTDLLMIQCIRKEKKDVTYDAVKKVLETLYPDQEITVTKAMKKEYTREKLRFTIIDAIKREAEAAKSGDIVQLCESAKRQLNKEPIVRKFTNKGLKHDLAQVLEPAKDKGGQAQALENNKENAKHKRIRTRIFYLADSLPTSDSSIQAFIVKHDRSTSEKIAYDIFAPSSNTAEHLLPQSQNGTDDITNIAAACKRCNNDRQDGPMEKLFRRHGRENAQLYADEVIADTNNGYYTYQDGLGILETLEQQSGIKINRDGLKFPQPRK